MDNALPASLALLPAGLCDLLPPEAETEARAVETVMAVFAAHGYARVRPPLLEFEDSLLGGSGAALAEQSFRVMDPDSHRMMAFRADITPQIARIATTRLTNAARPLRLSYAGQCIRTRSLQREGERQVPQVGIELIGHDSAAADAEVMLVGVEALVAIGLDRLSLDLTLPALAPVLVAAAATGENARLLARALDRKDAAQVAALGGAAAPMLTDLLLAAGPADQALAALAAADLPAAMRPLADRLTQVVALLRARAPGLKITIDPVEFRGFRYHTGVTFTVFSPGFGEELGRGGRYVCGDAEPATGLTLFADSVLRAAPIPAARQTVFLPVGADGAALRAAGYATVAALAAVDSIASEARRLGCTHAMIDGQLSVLKEI